MQNTTIFISLLFISILFSCKKTEQKQAEVPKSPEKEKVSEMSPTIPEYAKITPPVPSLKADYQIFTINNAQSQNLTTPSGTEIFVPSNAFTDKNGKSISGEITLKYREFHDAADILLSGIPMEIQTPQGLKYLTTAGMFEILGEKEGQAVQLAAGKKIKVNFASQAHENGYDFFKFQENTTGWEKIGTSNAKISPAVAEKLRDLEHSKEEVFQMPLGTDYFVFDYSMVLDILYGNDFQGNTRPQNRDLANEKSKEYGFRCYDMWCKTPIPFEGNEYPAALMLWKHHEGVAVPAWVLDYQEQQTMSVELRKTEEANVYEMECRNQNKFFSTRIEFVVPLKSLFAFSAEQWKTKQASVIQQIRKEEARIKAENVVMRSFEVANFGIYNYDKYLKEDGNLTVKGTFELPKNIKTNFGVNMVFFLPEDNRSVIKVSKDTWDKVVLLPKNRARFVCILPNQEIGVFSANSYKKIPFSSLQKQEKPEYSFALENKGKFQDAGDLRNILRF